MTLRHTRIAFRLIFLLPVAGLGLALFTTGLLRSFDELGGTPTPQDTLSGPATLALSLIPLIAVTLVTWALIRRPQKLPPPSPASIGPQARQTDPGPPAVGSLASERRFDLLTIRARAEALGLSLEGPSTDSTICLVKLHHWGPGYLLAAVIVVLAAWLLPPSLSAGSLALAPVNGGLIGFSLWISLFPLLLALPLSKRRVALNPERDEIKISDGRRVRVLGLSRLQSLEVRTLSESMRDSEIQSPSSTSRHAVLIAWIRAEGRGPTPFALVRGARQEDLEQARKDRSIMTDLAAALATGLGCPTGQPIGIDADELPYD